ncbi:MAG: carbohydrate-binding domain-containing protein [Ruminococcus sp.]|nr:carbohydrate-binding domain-containing protein [Ruminococcus sp.]
MKHQGRRVTWAVAMSLAAAVCATGCTEQDSTAEHASSAQSQTSTEETAPDNTAEAAQEEAVTEAGTAPADSTETSTAAAAVQLCTAENGSRASYDEDDMNGTYDSFDAEITLSGDSAEVAGDASGVTVSGGDVTISKGGTYRLSGMLTDGQLSITGTEKVKLYLDGVSITHTDGAAVVCTSEKRTILSLAEGTENTFQDGGSYTISEDDGAAAIYAKDKLTINGAGTLTVNGTVADGIVSKDDLKVTGGTVNVDAVHNGMKGTDSVSICGGMLNITAGNDALKSTKADNAEKGWIAIDGGEINAAAGGDGIQAETTLEMTAGTVNVTTNGEIDTTSSEEGWGGMMGGGFGGRGGRGGMDFFWQEDAAAEAETTADTTDTTAEESLSSKGIKSGAAMAITGGTINVTSTDHCVHADGGMDLTGGSYELTSTLAKGIKSVGDLTVSGEETAITIHQCTEGIESKSVMNLNGGNIRILDASDDGLNTGGMENPDHTMNINGGSIYINAAADGTDSNGDTNFNGGVMIVSGPESGANGSLDGDGTMTLNGGTVLGLSSRGMMEYPAGCMMTSSVNASSGDMLTVLDEEGNLVLAVQLSKNVSDVIFGDGSGAAMASYQLVTGGTFDGTLNEDGWAVEGSLDGGSSCTWSQTTSASGGMFGGGMQGGFGGRGGRDNMMQGDMEAMTPPEGFDSEMSGMPEMPEGGMGGMTPPGGFGGFGGMFGEESSDV